MSWCDTFAIRAFARLTCNRSGSASNDWHDRAGETIAWANQVVLRICDIQWCRSDFEICMPDGDREESLRGQVNGRRVKLHYHERYKYEH